MKKNIVGLEFRQSVNDSQDNSGGDKGPRGPTTRKIIHTIRGDNPGGQERINAFLTVCHELLCASCYYSCGHVFQSPLSLFSFIVFII